MRCGSNRISLFGDDPYRYAPVNATIKRAGDQDSGGRASVARGVLR